MKKIHWWITPTILGVIILGIIVSSFTHTFVYKKTDYGLSIFKGVVYAYSSEERQTDNSPFITAYNTPVREGIVANNCLAQGTIVEIKGQKYEVQDVMNARYNCQTFDIWMANTEDAWAWGRQELGIVVYK